MRRTDLSLSFGYAREQAIVRSGQCMRFEGTGENVILDSGFDMWKRFWERFLADGSL